MDRDVRKLNCVYIIKILNGLKYCRFKFFFRNWNNLLWVFNNFQDVWIEVVVIMFIEF